MSKRSRAEEPTGAPAASAPKAQHCFIAGDLVEAMYSDGCWVPGEVLDMRARQVLVRYEKESAAHSAVLGCWMVPNG